jgi:hypothetical protein
LQLDAENTGFEIFEGVKEALDIFKKSEDSIFNSFIEERKV